MPGCLLVFGVSGKTAVQVAVDVTDEKEALRIAGVVGSACLSGELPADRVILEVGTPLIKACGVGVISRMRVAAPQVKLLADMKTADVGRLEASLAYLSGADITTVLALAPRSTVKAVMETAVEMGREVSVDFLGVSLERAEPLLSEVISTASEVGLPAQHLIISFHRGIDEGAATSEYFERLAAVVSRLREREPRIRIAIAGGITPDAKRALETFFKPDIYVVGRYITAAPSVSRILEFLT
uniref:Orotidine 5'-phosphate decarboxylase domain-containing protein n=1 Tax=Thermofilum pendens TaxID=2269 RepID=A0A7C1P6W4_THEPE